MKGPGDDARKEGEKEKNEEDKKRERASCVCDRLLSSSSSFLRIMAWALACYESGADLGLGFVGVRLQLWVCLGGEG